MDGLGENPIKMDGLGGKPYEQIPYEQMDDLEGFPIFLVQHPNEPRWTLRRVFPLP